MPSTPLRKALIPVAGYGTRLFPATRIVKKEFFPVVGADGIARPAILTIIDEALSAGVEQIVLVVQPADLAHFRAFFTEPLSPGHYRKLSDPLRQEADHLLEIGQCIQFAIQPEPEGFGHAVWCAREAVGAEPFLMMLGDHLYRASVGYRCAAQLSSIYHLHGGNIVGLSLTQEEDLSSRGVVGGTWINPRRLLQISEIVEKPSKDYARRHCRIDHLPASQYLVLFGQYILQPSIFDHLDRLIREERRERGEFQFTSALEALRRDSGCLGYLIDGKTYDIGQPRLYLESIQAYAVPEGSS